MSDLFKEFMLFFIAVSLIFIAVALTRIDDAVSNLPAVLKVDLSPEKIRLYAEFHNNQFDVIAKTGSHIHLPGPGEGNKKK